MPSSNHPHRQPRHIDTRAEIKIKLRRQFPGVRYALTFLKRGGLALVLETPKEINTILKQTNKNSLGKTSTYTWPARTRSPGSV